jgi:hypothetical protein
VRTPSTTASDFDSCSAGTACGSPVASASLPDPTIFTPDVLASTYALLTSHPSLGLRRVRAAVQAADCEGTRNRKMGQEQGIGSLGRGEGSE